MCWPPENPAAAAVNALPGLAVGFYNASCPQVEDLVLAEMRVLVAKDRTIGPALLRFMFHDCLVRGCDASIMLKSRSKKGEQDATPSYGLRGYQEIEDIKAKVVEASSRAGLAHPASAAAVNALPGLPVAGLAVGFYNASCPQVEDLVLAEMRALVAKDRTIGPALLRFMFHDCLVRGCDASIMLKSRSKKGEQDAAPSYGLRGYQEIEDIKAKVEEACPLTVSCADIIALAARDAVYLSNGPRYAVETGRRDGKASAMSDADNDLPPPFSNIVDLKTYFSVKGLGWKDLVVLSGSHTIGSAQCSTFASDRLYNYSGKGVQDPSLNKTYAAGLRERCEAGLEDDDTPVYMDSTTPYEFDLGYYRDVASNTSLFLSDKALMDDRWTRAYVERMAAAASPDEFFADYAVAVTNMGRLEVLTGGDNGEIRKTCAAYVD